MAQFDWVSGQSEGQFFERKSCYDRSEGKLKRRDVRAVAWDVAETLSAMSNADGGTFGLGIEDDGTVSGCDYPDDRMQVITDAPQTHIRPPLRTHIQTGELNGKSVILFQVDWSSEVHQLTDGRYLLRVGDQNMPFPASDIEAMKEGKRRRVTEARFITEASLADIDMDLVADFAEGVNWAESLEDILVWYRLAERRPTGIALNLAGLLLFGKDPARWHPRCGIDFVRYEGRERRFGRELNIIKRERINQPLFTLLGKTYQAIQPQIRERQQLVGLLFEERLEYPTFAWQEAIVNAVAHRDYKYEGIGIEVWMFDDRLEIRSPGQLVEPVTLERLQRGERVHASRNPLIVRVLTDAGYMLEQGEGVPRVFEAMERQGLYPPEFRLEAEVIFNFTLRNTPIYSMETMHWLAQFEPLGLSGNQKRLLGYAKEHGDVFTSRAYQGLTHVDFYMASRDIKDLIRKGLVRLPQKGGRVYELVLSPDKTPAEKPPEYAALEPILVLQGFVRNRDIQQVLAITGVQAKRIARRLVELGWLEPQGEQRGRRYVPRLKNAQSR